MFFKGLPAQLPAIPKPIAQRKLLPMLGQALEFGGAPASALGEAACTSCAPACHVAPACT